MYDTNYWPVLGPVAIIILVGAFLAFEVFMFLDALKNPKLSDMEKLLWIAGMFFLHPIIAIVYYFTAHSRLS